MQGTVRTTSFDPLNRETDTSWDDGVTLSTEHTYDDDGELYAVNRATSGTLSGQVF